MENTELHEYNKYRVEVLNFVHSRKSSTTQEDLIAWLSKLLTERNPYAIQGVRDAIELHKPSGFKANPVWSGEWNEDISKGVAKHFWNIVS